jgi:hypothetical protein
MAVKYSAAGASVCTDCDAGATLRPGPVRLQYGSWTVVFSQNSLSAVAARTTRQVVTAVKYSAAGASVCTDCDAGKQEAL